MTRYLVARRPYSGMKIIGSEPQPISSLNKVVSSVPGIASVHVPYRSALHVLDLLWQIIECRMPVYFVFCGIKKSFGLVRVGRRDVSRLYYPYTYSFLSPSVYVSCISNGHSSISCMKATYMLVRQFLASQHMRLLHL